MNAIDAGQLEAERARLVRQCYRLTGALGSAEDLAQQTLYEAVRNAHKLRGSCAFGPWLFAIARNVCLRGNASCGRNLQLLDEEWDAPDDCDLEAELDRKELVTLLDRALELLPGETREILIERFVTASVTD